MDEAQTQNRTARKTPNQQQHVSSNDVVVGDVGDLVTLLRKTPNIIPKRFIGPLDHVVEFEVCAGPLEGALKIGDEVVKELAPRTDCASVDGRYRPISTINITIIMEN
uniref:Retrotransposon protein, putative, Ty3-gypsy subclass n=1 Tax=Oryza sativa subsp. japonica TaxID=39947 RepID=Q33B44_ORYSJ|nr:retrotransposon protein, putative, Ty3-gypsy subclass [Oryza sativa Japonica Group]